MATIYDFSRCLLETETASPGTGGPSKSSSRPGPLTSIIFLIRPSLDMLSRDVAACSRSLSRSSRGRQLLPARPRLDKRQCRRVPVTFATGKAEGLTWRVDGGKILKLDKYLVIYYKSHAISLFPVRLGLCRLGRCSIGLGHAYSGLI